MRIWFALGLLLLAGCAGPQNTQSTPEVDAVGPFAVVALIDTGINPYHMAFRDNHSYAYEHPSTYIPGYPADAVALNISLNHTDLQVLLEQDELLWENIDATTLYWIPGTKIIGAIGPGIFSSGHGTMVAGRAAGNEYSLCPDCRIVSVQGFNAQSVTWAAEQEWIDVQSNSWSPAVVFQQADPVQSPGLSDAFAAAAAKHMVFGSAGNGAMGKNGVIGHPSFTRATSGPSGVIAMGGHDNGNVIFWSGSVPYLVADSCDNWAPVGNTVTQYGDSEGGGTSSSSPYGAGLAVRIIQEARNVTGGGRSAELMVKGAPVADSPYLDDGELTMDELKEIMFRSAIPRPSYTLHDGAECSVASPYNTYPIAWEDIPPGAPSYYFIGFGQVSVDSLAAAIDGLLAGGLPAKSDTMQEHEMYQAVRDAYNDLP